MKSLRERVATCVWVLLVAALALCVSPLWATGQEEAKSQKEKVVVFARPMNDHMDVATAGSSEGVAQLAMVYDNLLALTKDGQTIPALAESWEVSPDYTTFTFHIRKGVKFQDGTPVNAEAVKFSYDRILRVNRSGVGGGYLKFANKDTCEVVDEYTLRMRLTAPFPRLLVDVAVPGYGIVSPTAIKAHMTTDDPEAIKWSADHAVGAGPFKLVEAIPGQRIVFQKDPNYWAADLKGVGRPLPKVDKVIFQEIKDPSVASLLLEKGDVDIVEGLPADQFESLKTKPGIKVVKYSAAKLIYVTYDVSKAPFNDINVRKAISYAINYEEIMAKVERGNVTRLHGLITSNFPSLGYDPTVGYNYDLAKAKEMMKASAYPTGFTTTLMFAPERRAEFEQVALYIQSYLKELGITVQLHKLAFTAQLAAQAKGEYGMSLMSFGPVKDPDSPCGYLLDMERGKGGWNGSFWVDKDVAAEVGKAATIAETDKRKALYQDANRKQFEQAIYCSLYEDGRLFAMRDTLSGFFYDLFNHGYFWEVTKK